MKKRWKLLLTLGLALVAVGFIAYLGLAVAPEAPNLVKLHKGSGTITTQDCIKCHGDKRSEVGFNTIIYTGHKRHNMNIYLRFNTLTPWDNDGDGRVDEDLPGDMNLDSAPGVIGVDDDADTLTDEAPIGYLTGDPGWNFDDDEDGLVDEDRREAECAKCHQQTDQSLGQVTTNEISDIINHIRKGSFEGGLLNDISAASKRVARKQVDPAFCVSCHGGFRTVASPNKPIIPNRPGLTPPVSVHQDPGNPTVTVDQTDSRGCTKCHRRNGPASDPQDEHRFVTYVNTRYASTSISCLKCHGGYVYYDVQEMNYPISTGFPPYWPQP